MYPVKTLKEMKSLTQKLAERYRRKERINDLLFLQAATVLPTIDAPSMMGAYLMVIQNVRFAEYHGQSPLKKNHFGSSLCTYIAEGLEIEEVLNDDENLVYLAKFYNKVDKLPAQIIYRYFKEEKADLLARLIRLMKKVLHKDQKKLEILAQGIPKLELLQKKIKELLPSYEVEMTLRWFPNKKRYYYLDFINFINESLDLYQRLKLTEHTTDKDKNDLYFYDYNARLGLILFVMMSITKEYSYLSPKRSELYKRCLKILNVSNLSDISFEHKELWLNALSLHLTTIKHLPAYSHLIKNLGEKILDSFIFKLHEIIHIEEKNHQTSKPAQYISKATSLVAQYGAGFAFTQLGRNYALTILGGVTGPIGVVIYSAAGTILMTQLGRLVTENLMPKAVSYVYAKVLEKLGNAIARGASEVFQYSFSVGKRGLKMILGDVYLKEDEKVFLVEWINTLLTLPDQVLSEEEKDQLRYALGIETQLIDTTNLTYLRNENQTSQPVVAL